MLVVDDHLLLDVLAGTASAWFPEGDSPPTIYTTSSWYYRLAGAAEIESGRGALSRRIGVLPDEDQREVRARLRSLPRQIGMVGPRRLIPAMAALRTRRALNFLSAEALALAIITDSEIWVRTDSPPLRESSEALLVRYRLAAD